MRLLAGTTLYRRGEPLQAGVRRALVMVLFFQRRIVAGLTAGAVKG